MQGLSQLQCMRSNCTVTSTLQESLSPMERLQMERGPTHAQLFGLHQPRYRRWVEKSSDDSSFRCSVTTIAQETPEWKLLTDPSQPHKNLPSHGLNSIHFPGENWLCLQQSRIIQGHADSWDIWHFPRGIWRNGYFLSHVISTFFPQIYLGENEPSTSDFLRKNFPHGWI